ncbi:uncharacterized protein LOC116852209 [Odontomachus brunneus]|uniref:uncharacterized protein LOC116852209 n=1 Tax=Odontomachus brunneus TaxID=486640 RepID=UPI0013F26385|nr:uncharacterized protein LOC116852209 [Odontomachus brunneus]
MMSFNAWNVILLLYATFSALDLPQSPITSEEIEMKKKVEYMLKEIENDNEFEIEEEQVLDFYDPNEIPHAETVDLFHHVEDENYLPEEVICTSVEAAISNDYKRQAVEYWRSGKTRPKSLESVKHNYKQVTSLR